MINHLSNWNSFSCWLKNYPFEPEEDFDFTYACGGHKYFPNLPYTIKKYKSDSISSIRIPAVANGTHPVKGISNNAFAGCKAECIIIPTSVEHIGQYAFANCKRLRTITLPRNVKISQGAFEGCTQLKDVFFAGTYEEFKNLHIVTGKVETCITGAEHGRDEMIETYLKHLPGNEPLLNATIHFECEYEDKVVGS